MKSKIEIIEPENFDAQNHFYPKAVNSQMHSLVSHFFNLDHARLVERYVHLNPKVDKNTLKELLAYESKHFYWGGSDLFYVTTEKGNRKMVILETNSCPSGQKSMPPRTDSDEYRGYRRLLEQSFLPLLKKKRLPKGALAVIYDKNYMENSGYASTLSDLTGEKVYLIPHFDNQSERISFDEGVMKLHINGEKIPIRAAFRYVTNKPWNRLPIQTKTLIYNSTLACLAGGRNKLLANKSYELFNAEIQESGLKISMPETIKDVSQPEIPLWVQRFGGKAVIKIPYSNAGQGVFTITTPEELDAFMAQDHGYDQFIVQSLIGHYNWSSHSSEGKYYHIGTVPDKKGNIYIADLRMMVYSSADGFYPVAIYARRARKPLTPHSPENSWEVLGTNLSVKLGENQWDSDTARLMLMDQRDFNTLGLGLDDLIEAYIQTILSIIAIDKMAGNLVNKKGKFKKKLFQSLDNDEVLMNEIVY